MNRHLANPWISGAPILMSLSVLALIAYQLLRFGPHAGHHDEGAVERIAILLMLGQIPILAAVVVAQWKDLAHRLPAIGAQVALWGLTLACGSLT